MLSLKILKFEVTFHIISLYFHYCKKYWLFQNCEHNTYGDYCELCKPGYQGDALIGGTSACTKCACPLPDNSFSDTCLAVGHGRGYMCDACKPGYTGLYCEKCLTGYYGNPNIVGGMCKECDCHQHGSVHGICNQASFVIIFWN